MFLNVNDHVYKIHIINVLFMFEMVFIEINVMINNRNRKLNTGKPSLVI